MASIKVLMNIPETHLIIEVDEDCNTHIAATDYEGIVEACLATVDRFGRIFITPANDRETTEVFL